MKRSVEARLIEAMQEAVAVHRGTARPARVVTVKLDAREATVAKPAPIAAADVVRARAALAVSQPVFADLLNVSLKTVQGWEQGAREPSGAAVRLLDMVRTNPRSFQELMAATRKRPRKTEHAHKVVAKGIIQRMRDRRKAQRRAEDRTPQPKPVGRALAPR